MEFAIDKKSVFNYLCRGCSWLTHPHRPPLEANLKSHACLIHINKSFSVPVQKSNAEHIFRADFKRLRRRQLHNALRAGRAGVEEGTERQGERKTEIEM